MTKEITETLRRVVHVRIRSNGSKEARAVALRLARVHIDAWSSETGGVSIVVNKKSTKFLEEGAPK